MGTTYVVPGLATLQALRGHSGRISHHETSHTLPGLMVEKEPPSLQSPSPHQGGYRGSERSRNFPRPYWW